MVFGPFSYVLRKVFERGVIPREDVAKTVFAVLDKENTYKRTFDLVSGEDNVETAISNI